MYYPHRLSALYAYAHGGDVLYKEGTGRQASGVRRQARQGLEFQTLIEP